MTSLGKSARLVTVSPGAAVGDENSASDPAEVGKAVATGGEPMDTAGWGVDPGIPPLSVIDWGTSAGRFSLGEVVFPTKSGSGVGGKSTGCRLPQSFGAAAQSAISKVPSDRRAMVSRSFTAGETLRVV
jgi:hypothetical protein